MISINNSMKISLPVVWHWKCLSALLQLLKALMYHTSKGSCRQKLLHPTVKVTRALFV